MLQPAGGDVDPVTGRRVVARAGGAVTELLVHCGLAVLPWVTTGGRLVVGCGPSRVPVTNINFREPTSCPQHLSSRHNFKLHIFFLKASLVLLFLLSYLPYNDWMA